MPRRTTAGRITSMAAAIALLAPAAVLVAGPAQSASSTTSDAAAASSNSVWVAAQLLDDGTFDNPDNPDLPDHGLMIDAVLAMYASGDGERAAPIVELLDGGAEARRYFTFYGFGKGQEWLTNEGLDDRIGGATAKALVAAEASGSNPRDFGGYDMVKETQNAIVHPADVEPGGRFAAESTLNPNFVIRPKEVGRVVDYGPTTGNNDANTFGQALAVIGLAGVQQNDSDAIDKLTWQQCSEGYFRIFYSYDSDDELATCDEGKQTDQSGPDRDSTGLGLSAMAAARRAGATGLDDPIERATAWLESEQQSDGGWGGGVNTEAQNTNSTGLAVQALADVGADPDVIAKGATYLRSAQVGSADADNALKNDVGAIAYTPEQYQQAKTVKGGVGGSDAWIRASAQASLGLSRVSFSQLVRLPGTAPLPTQPTPTPTRPSPSKTPAKTSSGGSPNASAPGQQQSQGPASRPQQAAPKPGRTQTPPPRPRVVGGPPASTTTPPPLPRPDYSRPNAPGVKRPAVKALAPGSAPSLGSASAASPWLQPSSTTAPGNLARYLAGSLVKGERVEVVDAGKRFVDYDATADTVLALRSLGEQPASVTRASRFLLTPDAVRAYAHGAPYDSAKAAYAEPLAKLLLIGQMSQRDGDRTKATTSQVEALHTSLLSLQSNDGTFDDTGRFADRTDTMRRHTMATVAVTAADDGPAADRAAGALLSRQCTDGTFAASLAQTTCDSGELTATGWAAQALGVRPQPAPAAMRSSAGSAATVSVRVPVLDPAVGPVTNAADRQSTPDRSGPFGIGAAIVRAAVVGLAEPTVGNAGVPSTWSGKRVDAVRRVTTALQTQPRADGLVLTDGKADLAGSSVVAAGRQAVGLDASKTALTLGRRMLPDGGLAAAGGKKSDFTTSLAAANGVAGGSWLTRSDSPVTPVAVGLADAKPAATVAAATAGNNPWWQRPWAFAIWLLLAAAIGALAHAGARRRRPATHPTDPPPTAAMAGRTRHNRSASETRTPNNGDPS